jgi:hypothetical protein
MSVERPTGQIKSLHLRAIVAEAPADQSHWSASEQDAASELEKRALVAETNRAASELARRRAEHQRREAEKRARKHEKHARKREKLEAQLRLEEEERQAASDAKLGRLVRRLGEILGAVFVCATAVGLWAPLAIAALVIGYIVAWNIGRLVGLG